MKKFLVLLAASAILTSTAGSCKKESSTKTPDLYINGSLFTVAEDEPSGSIVIPVSLSSAYGKEVSVDYTVSDSTAVSGKDYSCQPSGKLVFEPGKTLNTITISILNDTARKEDTWFRVVLSNPVNGNLKGSNGRVRIINVDFANLVWSDEFTTGPLNASDWNYEQGATGWGNNELENYTNSIDNVHIDSGYLHITALNPSGSSYTSGRITTQGKREFTYGRIEIRAKLPEGQGLWPALWMLGKNIPTAGWPTCGEIDIMELLGHQPFKVYGTLHWNNNGHQSQGGQYDLQNGTFSSGFHNFTLIWTPSYFKWLVDSHQYLSFSRAEVSQFPFDLPQFFIFNVAVGGNWPGSPDLTTRFPQNMIVDYIRVYQ